MLIPTAPLPPAGTPEIELASPAPSRRRHQRKSCACSCADRKVPTQRMVDGSAARGAHAPFEIHSNHGRRGDVTVNIKDSFRAMFGQPEEKTQNERGRRFDYRSRKRKTNCETCQVTRVAVEARGADGIIFIDEIDKVAGRESATARMFRGEGVCSRDILPILSRARRSNTRYGMIARVISCSSRRRVSRDQAVDLIPELQGRLPIRVELQSRRKRISSDMTEPKKRCLKQYVALLETKA